MTNAASTGAPAPHLFTFRRCPYAIRARLALAAAALPYSRTEVVLRDKPQALLAASPKGTVPVLVLADGQVIDESLDIMLWALRRNDPLGWLQPTTALQPALAVVADMDTRFKPLLDRCKYPERYPDVRLQESRAHAIAWLTPLEQRLAESAALFGPATNVGDAAIFPFVRQFAAIDVDWWQVQPLPRLQAWRERWLALPLFQQVMAKPTAAAR